MRMIRVIIPSLFFTETIHATETDRQRAGYVVDHCIAMGER